jgi:DNA-binding CsgD family transcriptional regulator
MATANWVAGEALLERERELGAIASRIETVRDGTGSALFVEGPAGIGKTELLRAARHAAAAAGMAVLSARGGELERSVGFGIVRQLFEATLVKASGIERIGLLAGAASLAIPAFDPAQEPEPPAPPFGDPAAAIQHGLYWLVANLAGRRPLLLAVDDLQWSDLASARWLVYLARRLDDIPVLLIAANREGEPGLDPALLAALADEPVAGTLRPGPLSEAAATELVRAGLGEEAEAEFASACYRATAGNPLLVGQLLEAIRADAIPPTAGSVGRIENLGPEAISRSVLIRLARLPAGTGPLTRAVAVLGSAATARRAARLAGLDKSGAASASDALVAASILASNAPLRFAHPVLRTVVYEQIPAAARSLAHATAAGLLKDDGAPAEQIAAHLLNTQPDGDEWVVATLRNAATAAAARGAPDAAIAYLRRALHEPTAPELRTDLLCELLGNGIRAADWSIFEGISDDPLRELSGTRGVLMQSAYGLASWLFASGRLQEASEVLERAIGAAQKAEDYQLAIRLESVHRSWIQPGPEEANARLDRYEGRIERGTPAERLWLGARAHLQNWDGSAAEGARLARRALEGGTLLAERWYSLAVAEPILVLLRADQLNAAEPVIDRVADDARTRGSVAGFVLASIVRAELSRRRGDLPSEADEARAAIDMSRQHGLALVVALAAAWFVDAAIELGAHEDANVTLRTTGMDGPLPDHMLFMPIRLARARLRIAQGTSDQGITELRELLAFAQITWPQSYPIASTLALALASRHQEPDEVQRLVEWELAEARRWGTPRTMGVALRAQGLVEGGDRGIELLREAAEKFAASPDRLEHARTLVDLGAALRRGRRPADARPPLHEGLELASRCGATPLAERARAELAATGVKRIKRTYLSGLDALTPSEKRIARMAANGMSNPEIAQTLFVTRKTVEMHLHNAYIKLDVKSRDQLPAAIADPP